MQAAASAPSEPRFNRDAQFSRDAEQLCDQLAEQSGRTKRWKARYIQARDRATAAEDDATRSAEIHTHDTGAIEERLRELRATFQETTRQALGRELSLTEGHTQSVKQLGDELAKRSAALRRAALQLATERKQNAVLKRRATELVQALTLARRGLAQLKAFSMERRARSSRLRLELQRRLSHQHRTLEALEKDKQTLASETRFFDAIYRNNQRCLDRHEDRLSNDGENAA